MFRNLKEKLKNFRKKATEELQEGKGSPGSPGGGKDTGDGSDINGSSQRSDEKVPSSSETKARTKPVAPDVKVKPMRKRSRGLQTQPTSLKRKIEKETADSTPWEKVDSKPLDEVSSTGWFAKSISESKLESILWELEMALLESDVALPVVEEIKSFLKNDLLNRKFKPGTDFEEIIEEALRSAVINVLQKEMIHFDNFVDETKKPVKLMFVGVNGTGKTSAIAKIAFRLKKQKRSCVIAASDTFRAGAIEQLEKHANKLGVKLIKDKAGSDPAAIAFDTIEHAKARHKEVVMIDTAGRMQTNQNLMDEMRKIKRVAEPHMIIFVGDALAGNDVVEQAKQFDKVVGVDAAILTKIDADAKGGAALSIAHAIGKPILFISVGQRYGDILPFNPEWLVKRIFE
jgi:fused signal recognition particle receptor